MEIKFCCQVRLKEADEAVEAVSAVMENMILEENVERAIEAALAEPGDFEYAIDTEVKWMIYNRLHPLLRCACHHEHLLLQGHIFWGRKTLCNKIDKKLLEKIPGVESAEEEKFTLQN